MLTLVHPSLRRFFLSHRNVIKPRTRARNRTISLAMNIKRRILNYKPLPRVPPFFCDKCHFSSYSYRKVKDHVCSKKAPPINEFEHEMKIARMGFRSRCKDALAVLERAYYPQKFHLSPIQISDVEPSTSAYNPPSLRRLANNAMKKVPRSCSFLPMKMFFHDVGGLCRLYSDEVTRYSTSAFCRNCQQLYNSYDEYDAHLETKPCCLIRNPDPVLIQTRCDSTIPAEYEYGRRVSTCCLESNETLLCTACGVKSSRFASVGNFHEHLFECARKLQTG